MATVGKNILDNLTTGMYADSKVIYREYIQNACDQIDIAVKEGLLGQNDGQVDIFIDAEKRYVSIKDNATGVRENSFISDLGNIANSNKKIGENKGFRGIGRLCGLAYCRILRFRTSYAGEKVASVMTCDAKRMREMLIEDKKYTLDDIWDTIVSFETVKEKDSEHYFEVELIDINHENTDLLDDGKIRSYLSFVAPVPYKSVFMLRDQIYEYATSINYHIDEYNIAVNGAPIFKEYTTKLKRKVGNNIQNYDDIFKLEFKDFRDANGKLLAWMWIGLSGFEIQIPNVNPSRGLRLRSHNIQLGDDDVLQSLFKESRGNYYFVGEVFAVNKSLIPNSQRDYFNENEARVMFEDALRIYFFDTLHKLYTEANKIKNALKHQQDYLDKVDEFEKKSEDGFIDEDAKHKLQIEIEESRKKAEEGRKQLEKYKDSDSLTPISEVHQRITTKFNAGELEKKAERTKPPEDDPKKVTYTTQKFSKLTRNERKIVSKIMSIVTDEASDDVAKRIIDRIKEELK